MKYIVTNLYRKFDLPLPDNISDLEKSPELEVCSFSVINLSLYICRNSLEVLYKYKQICRQHGLKMYLLLRCAMHFVKSIFMDLLLHFNATLSKVFRLLHNIVLLKIFNSSFFNMQLTRLLLIDEMLVYIGFVVMFKTWYG